MRQRTTCLRVVPNPRYRCRWRRPEPERPIQSQRISGTDGPRAGRSLASGPSRLDKTSLCGEQLRCGYLFRGSGAYRGQPECCIGTGASSQTRGRSDRDSPAFLAGTHLLGNFKFLPSGTRGSYQDIQETRIVGTSRSGRSAMSADRLPARSSRALLVAKVHGRAQKRDFPSGQGLPKVSRMGHRQTSAPDDLDGSNFESIDRKEHCFLFNKRCQ